MNATFVRSLLALLLVASAAYGQEGRYKLRLDRPASAVGLFPVAPIPLRDRAVIERDGAQLEFSSRTLGTYQGAAGTAAGPWTLTRTNRPGSGMTGRLEGAQQGAEEEVILELKRSERREGVLLGRVLRDGRVLQRVHLSTAPRALIVYTSVRMWHERPKLLYRVMEAENEYRKRGYSLVRLKADTVPELTARLERAAEAGDPFERVVIIAHAGRRDGPVFGYSKDGEKREDQVSPHYNQHLWPAFTAALREGTTEDALIYAGGCHTGGFDSEERGRTNKPDPRPDERSWVETVSRASGRTVIGPAGLTSWWKTHDAILAMEGEGGAPQELRWATPERAVIVGTGERRDAAFADVPEITGQLGAAAPGETITITARGFALAQGQERLQVLVVFESKQVYARTTSAEPESTVVEVTVPKDTQPGERRVTLRVGGESASATLRVE